MDELLAIGKALSDPSRVRAMMAVSQRELCLCELITMLELAPATVSRHMAVLVAAGLVTRRKQGRWQYFRLASRDASDTVRQAVRWVRRSLASDPTVAADAKRLEKLSEAARTELCACYR